MKLTGKTIVITRAAAQSADLRNRLEDLGARVIECPTIQIVPPKSWKPVDEAIRRLNTYQWLLFTSANAVEQLRRAVRRRIVENDNFDILLVILRDGPQARQRQLGSIVNKEHDGNRRLFRLR